MKRRALWMILLAVFLVAGLTPLAFSQEKYPEKPIQIIVPFGPGGSTDLCIRSFMGDVAKILNQPVNILNRPGAGGLTGTDAVSLAKPDGYTLLATSAGVLTWSPALDPKTYRELDHLAILANQPVLISTRSESEFKTIDDMINQARKRPNDLTCGSTGVQSETYLDLAILEATAGIKIRHVPIANSTEGMSNLMGGHIDFWVGSIAITQNLMRAGRLRGLAVSTSKRMKDFPDMPTFAEKGYPQVNVNLIIVMAGPKGLPPAVTKAWEDALKVVMAKPETVANLNKLNFDVDLQVGREKLRKYFSDEVKRFTVLAKERGIK